MMRAVTPHGRRLLIRMAVNGAVIVGLALAAQTRYRVTINLTKSLPGTMYLIALGEKPSKGELIAFEWHGGVGYKQGLIFIKQVVGVEGDVSRLEGNTMYLGNQVIGEVLLKTRRGDALQAAATGPVSKGEYFVTTPSPRSLDSRYAVVGNVKQNEIMGKAYEIF